MCDGCKQFASLEVLNTFVLLLNICIMMSWLIRESALEVVEVELD